MDNVFLESKLNFHGKFEFIFLYEICQKYIVHIAVILIINLCYYTFIIFCKFYLLFRFIQLNKKILDARKSMVLFLKCFTFYDTLSLFYLIDILIYLSSVFIYGMNGYSYPENTWTLSYRNYFQYINKIKYECSVMKSKMILINASKFIRWIHLLIQWG